MTFSFTARLITPRIVLSICVAERALLWRHFFLIIGRKLEERGKLYFFAFSLDCLHIIFYFFFLVAFFLDL